MRRNVEIEARVSNPTGLCEHFQALATSGPTVLDQEDTFFACPRGRLKPQRLIPLADRACADLLVGGPAPRGARTVR